MTRWALPLIAAACFVRLWLMPLASSFWVDEMATVFVVEHGADDASLQVAPQVPQSIYYSVIRALSPGRSEVVYRLPSIVFMTLAMVFIALLVRRLIHPDAWWFAILACLTMRGINYEAGNARPYAIGMCVATAALYFLVRWFDTREVWNAVRFLTLAALLWRVHLIFWPFYLVFVLYALMRIKDAPFWQVASIFGALGVLLIPVAIRAVHLNAQAKEHVVVAEPGLLDLTYSLRLVLILGPAFAAWICSRFVPRDRVVITASAVALIVGWWLIHPLGLFAFSHLTGNSVFLSRYLALSLPGTAVASTLAVAWFLPSRFWKPAAVVAGLYALIVLGHWSELWPHHHNSDWRAAARAVNELALPPAVPVICPSPFIEARPPDWTPDYKMPGFLYAHLLVYPVRGNVVLFPFATSPEAEDYAAALVKGAIPAAGRFVIYGGNGQAHFWRDWFEKRPELEGWSHRSLGQFNDVDVELFERRIANPPQAASLHYLLRGRGF